MPAKSNTNYKNSKVGNDELLELKEQLKTGKLKRIYLFSGEERYLIDYYVKELKKAAHVDDKDGLNLIQFEGKTDVNRIIDSCDTYPIFAEKKLVIIKGSNLFAAKKKSAQEQDDPDEDSVQADEKNESDAKSEVDSSSSGNTAQENFKNYISDIPESTCLILIEDNIDKRLGTYKAAIKAGLHIDFAYSKPDELANWVIKGFRQSNKTISIDVAQYLVSISEPDMYALKNEIAKIDQFTGDKKIIEIEDVKAVATVTIKSIIFDLMDAIAYKNKAKALVYLDDMLSLKEPEQKILAMIAKQTGEILKLKILMDRHISNNEITKFFPQKHPYVFKKLTELAQRADKKYLTGFLKKCMDEDFSYKRGKTSPRLSLELLIDHIQ